VKIPGGAAETLAFWQQAFHYVLRERPDDQGWAVLVDPSGIGVNLSYLRGE